MKADRYETKVEWSSSKVTRRHFKMQSPPAILLAAATWEVCAQESFENNFEVSLVVMKVSMARINLGLSILVAAIFNHVLSLGLTLGTFASC